MKILTQLSITFSLIAFGESVYAQTLKHGSLWYLGEYTGVDFKHNPPKILNDSKIRQLANRTSCITDESGNLLFYTNTDTVWNKYHQVMQNGIGINAYHSGDPATSVIVPHPGDGQLYYVFISNRGNDINFPSSGFIYALADISEDGGRGAIIQKNIKLLDKSTSLLTVTSHADEKSFWVITHGFGDSKFYTYKVSESGIEAPVISIIGSVYSDGVNQMKVSPDGTKLAVSNLGVPELFNFDSKTGIVSSARTLASADTGAGGVEFSPNSELLYFATGYGTIIQFDVRIENIDDIRMSKQELGEKIGGGWIELQLAYNGKIYGGFGINGKLVSIENPNIKGSGCNYSLEGLFLPPGIVGIHMPLSVQSYYRESPAIVGLHSCKNIPAQLQITSMGYADSLIWDFGDGAVKSYLPVNGKTVNHVYMQSGQYSVKVKKYIGNLYREISTTVSIIDKPEVNLGADTILCEGENIMLDAGAQGVTYKWSTGASTPTIVVSKTGTYQVEVNNGVCTTIDKITIGVNAYPEVSLGSDQILCTEGSVELSVVNNPEYAYRWSTGNNTSLISVTESGEYKVEVKNGRCQSTDQINIQFAAIRDLALAENSLVVPYGKELTLQANGSNINSWKWIFGNGEETETDIPAVNYSYPKAGFYEGKLVASNSWGCKDEIPFTVEIPEYLFIPNVFTPNGDGLNDTFEIQYNGREDFNLMIYNRWGDAVFSSDTLEERWGGTGISNGIYYYKVNFGRMSYKGWVVVLL